MSTDDEDVAGLLRLAGPRREPPAALRARMHASALQVFESLPEPEPEPESEPESRAAPLASGRPLWQRLRSATAIAAVLLLCVGGAVFMTTRSAIERPAVAYVNHSSGTWLLDDRAAARNEPVPRAARVRTTANTLLELQLRDGKLLRADRDTLFVLHGTDSIELTRGRIFIDARGSSSSVRVVTAFGSVRDVGTQFEVQIGRSELTVVVREGEVRVDTDHTRLAEHREFSARAEDGVGEALRVDARGRIRRSRVSTTDAHWNWLANARPTYALDRGSLHDFLVWSASESGLQLRYQNETVRRAAVQTRTRGNIAGMRLEEAIANVLATTRLRRKTAAPFELLVDFADAE